MKKSEGAPSRGLLPELLGYRLRRAQMRVFNDFIATLRERDLTPGLYGVLVLIDANPDLNQSQLGRAMGVDRSTVVAVIDRLERRSVVARRPSAVDRRAHRLVLTSEGQALCWPRRPRWLGRTRRASPGGSRPSSRRSCWRCSIHWADGPLVNRSAGR